MKMDRNKQTLPPKENSLFKRVLKCYEQKQYKNGLKFAKLILTNFPDHGETMAMKGLTLNCLGKKEEAYNCVRLGLRNNLTSHVCWHVYGLLQRSDKKYEEAIKCYRNALKWDKDNLQILRDLSLLQIQMRDLDGYKETRYKLFDLRPTQRASWIGYGMSFHLLKDYDTALHIIEEFRKTIQKTTYDYEYSELLLYQNLVIRESGDSHKALEHLETYKSSICDKVTLEEVKGEILMVLNRQNESAEVYRGLIGRNPENKNYYIQLERALGLDSEEEKLKLYAELKEKYPRAHVPRRIPLNYATGERLEELIDPYLRAALKKGVPPLFTDIRGLYADPDKIKVIEGLMEGYVKSLKDTGYLSEKDNDYKEPASILYGLMYLAQHFSYLGDTAKALDLLQQALDHTPTLIELYILKGKILKHAGDYIGASEAMNEAQSLDTADRYVNSKAASYLLKAGHVSEAEVMCSKFTREGVSAMENLNEMQCMWFQSECAKAYFDDGKLGHALKKCHEINNHFNEIIEDQFDFHTYCMRKMTLRSYVELLRLEDIIRSNRFYWDAALIAIKIYLRLHDKPLTGSDEIDTTGKSAAEVKRLKAKQRRSQKKADQIQSEDKKEESNKHKNKNNKNDDSDSPKVDELVPSKLERPVDALHEAVQFLQPLQVLAADRIQTHILSFQVYWRRKKPLLMLQSLKRALKLDPSYPELHPCLVRFLRYRQEKLSDGSLVEGPVSEVIENELSRLVSPDCGLDPVKVNEAFLNDHKDSAPHRLEAARAMFELDAVQRDRALTIGLSLDQHLTDRTLQHCFNALEWIVSTDELQSTPEEVERFKSSVRVIQPYANLFQPPREQLQNVEEELTNNHNEEQPVSDKTEIFS